MADSMDMAQARADELLARNIASVVNRPVSVAASFCEDCDAPIPEARRRAIHGVTRCVECQELKEKSNAFN
ncbi:TraR/DksA family transcriptional regulator [Pantoea agglomerans pv. betae]|jgi:phage/conjugal plasmid C-4 type zinc finger TraR family protein|uniref:TraR/DksA family transcriptional regulator n=1 Tax=Enterobacter agglomerans TaxID=549 RepID=UPI0007E540AB|nr:TraR/DksA family transcriptional regulator [Pantoea agglomerans]WHU84786.1 TraR/DksA family transcriptional regulator [Pantoea agglomerans pv. betae]